MVKEFEYKGFRFSIDVELRSKVTVLEVWHTVTVKCKDAKEYFKKSTVADKMLVKRVAECEKEAMRFVDKKMKV